MTSLWRNASVNVVANSNWSCLLISAPKVHWRVQQTAAGRSGRFNQTHEECIASVSQQCHHENCQQMIEKEQRPPNNSPNLNGMEISCLTREALLKHSSETQNSFWIKNRTGEDMGHFSASPINIAAPSSTISLTRVCERWRKTF